MTRSARDLQRYTIQATDGDSGKIDDLYFEGNSWTVRYLVANVGNWLSRQQVLLIPDFIREIDPEARNLLVSLTKEQVQSSPDVDSQKPDVLLSRDYEQRLHPHYEQSDRS